MADKLALEEARNETFRKIGRNVFVLQQMEAMLKVLISYHKIEGRAEDLDAIRDRNLREVRRRSMGNLVNDLVRKVYTNNEITPEEDEATAGNLSFSFKIESSGAGIKESRKALNAIVAERNTLIHGTLGRLDTNSVESCMDLSKILDDQFESIKPEYANLRGLVVALKDGTRELMKYLSSELSAKAPNDAEADG